MFHLEPTPISLKVICKLIANWLRVGINFISLGDSIFKIEHRNVFLMGHRVETIRVEQGQVFSESYSGWQENTWRSFYIRNKQGLMEGVSALKPAQISKEASLSCDRFRYRGNSLQESLDAIMYFLLAQRKRCRFQVKRDYIKNRKEVQIHR